MLPDIDKALLNKIVSGNATSEEIKRFNKYLETLDSQQYSKFLDEYETMFSSYSFDDESAESRWLTLLDRITYYENKLKGNKKTSKTPSKTVWISIAAVLLIVSSFLFYFNHHLFTNHPTGKLVNNIQAKNDIEPGKNRAILKLHDGSSFDLENLDDGMIINQPQFTVTKTQDGQLVYQTKEIETAENLSAYNILETPKGGQFQILLPDGTSVWLNASSKLKFPTQFSGQERKVELSGEGYFEVAKNKEKPFIVSTEKEVIKVLGTHFNVNSYEDETFSRTTLVEGKVKVSMAQQSDKPSSSALLSPGQQSIINKTGMRVLDVAAQDAIAWKNGDFMFNDERIESVMRTLARWYNVEIIYQIPLNEIKIWGSISRFKNISEVLNVIELTELVKFKIEGRRIYVMKA